MKLSGSIGAAGSCIALCLSLPPVCVNWSHSYVWSRCRRDVVSVEGCFFFLQVLLFLALEESSSRTLNRNIRCRKMEYFFVRFSSFS